MKFCIRPAVHVHVVLVLVGLYEYVCRKAEVEQNGRAMILVLVIAIQHIVIGASKGYRIFIGIHVLLVGF